MSTDDHLYFHRRAGDDVPEEIPPGMTVEQLNFFTEQTQRAVRKVTRRDRATNRVAYLLLTVGLAVALAISFRQAANQRESIVRSGKAVAVEGCNRDYVDRQNFRATISRLRVAARSSDSPTRANAIRFYTEVLKVNPTLDCRAAQNVLTDDADAKIPTILPYFTGAPYAPVAPTLDG